MKGVGIPAFVGLGFRKLNWRVTKGCFVVAMECRTSLLRESFLLSIMQIDFVLTKKIIFSLQTSAASDN